VVPGFIGTHKLTSWLSGDIVDFVMRRCAENGLEYLGGIGRAENRVMQAYVQETLGNGSY
jgi:hypothetical protein